MIAIALALMVSFTPTPDPVEPVPVVTETPVIGEPEFPPASGEGTCITNPDCHPYMPIDEYELPVELPNTGVPLLLLPLAVAVVGVGSALKWRKR